MIAIIKYNAGNIRSVENAIHRLGYKFIISDDPDEIRKAEKVIFPGVGHALPAMQYLKKYGLDKLIPSLKQPVLGICLGLQLMCAKSEEGPCEGMKIFDCKVSKFNGDSIIPHMGWNEVYDSRGSIFKGISHGADFYFVHSFFAELCDHTIAHSDYIQEFSAALQKDNFYATQFHPEKSGSTGELVLKNFLEL